MKTVTFISNQNNITFPHNTNTNFAVLLNQRQKQDTNQHHNYGIPNYLTLNKFITDIDPSAEARLFILSCSLVRDTSLFNAKPSNVYKVLCLAPQDYTGLGYSVNFKTVDPLPLVHNEDQIKFNLSSLKSVNLIQTLYHTTFPTVINFIGCPVQPIRLNSMSHWYNNQTKIILDSSDKNSQRYRQNNGVDFEIVLDTPINTANETWSIELNAIFIHHRIFNTFPLTIQPEHLTFSLGVVTQKDKTGAATDFDFQITPINFWSSSRTFNSAKDLLQTINFKFKKYSRAYGRAEFNMGRGNKVVWIYKQSNMSEDKWEDFDLKRTVDKNVVDVVLLLPKSGLAQLLGFITPEEATAEETNQIVLSLWSRAHLIDLSKTPFPQTNKGYFYKKTVTPHPAFLHPSPTNLQTPLVITCNLVETSLLGLNHLRVLRLITTHDNFKYPYICYNEFEQPLSVTLETKTFSRIHIQLCDLKGNLVSISPAALDTSDHNTVVVLTLRKQST